MLDVMLIPDGMPVYKSNFLPYEALYPACDIQTKGEVFMRSGEWVHAFKLGDAIHVSEALFEKLSNAPSHPR